MSDFLVVQDEMPSGRSRDNALGPKVEAVLRDQSLHGKAVCIEAWPVDDKNKSRAASAVQGLRVKYGRDATSLGLTFATGRVQVDNSEMIGVWVKCEPGEVVPGAYEKHKAEERRKVQEQNAKKKAKEAEAKAEAA